MQFHLRAFFLDWYVSAKKNQFDFCALVSFLTYLEKPEAVLTKRLTKKLDNDCCAGKYSLFLITGTKLLSLYNKFIVARKTSRLQIVGAYYCPLEEKTIGTNDTEFALNDTFCSLPTGILAKTNCHHFRKTCSTD